MRISAGLAEVHRPAAGEGTGRRLGRGCPPGRSAARLEVYTSHFDSLEAVEMVTAPAATGSTAGCWTGGAAVPNGEFAGYVGYVDVTDRKAAIEQLRDSHEPGPGQPAPAPRRWSGRRLAREMHDDLTQGGSDGYRDRQGGRADRASHPGGRIAPQDRATSWSSCLRTCIPCRAQLHPSILDDLGLVDALRSSASATAAGGDYHQLSHRQRAGRPVQGRRPVPVPHRPGGVAKRRPSRRDQQCRGVSDWIQWRSSADDRRQGQRLRSE